MPIYFDQTAGTDNKHRFLKYKTDVRVHPANYYLKYYRAIPAEAGSPLRSDMQSWNYVAASGQLRHCAIVPLRH